MLSDARRGLRASIAHGRLIAGCVRSRAFLLLMLLLLVQSLEWFETFFSPRIRRTCRSRRGGRARMLRCCHMSSPSFHCVHCEGAARGAWLRALETALAAGKH